MGSATTIQQLINPAPALTPATWLRPVHVAASRAAPFVRQIGAALGVTAFVLAATVGDFRMGLLVMIAVSAGTLPASWRCQRTVCMRRIEAM
jgi:hypothetical protein